MDSVTEENVAHIMKDKDTTEAELAKLRSTTVETMWLNELTVLDKEYSAYKKKRETIQRGDGKASSSKKKTTKTRVVKRTK